MEQTHLFSGVSAQSYCCNRRCRSLWLPTIINRRLQCYLPVSLPPAEKQMRSIMLHPWVSLEPMDFTLFTGQSFNSASHAHYTQKNPCSLWVRTLKLQIGVFSEIFFAMSHFFFLLITCFMLIATVFSTSYSSWKGIYGSHSSTTDGRSLPKC